MRWLVRLYPSSWRERYGEEFSALLDDVPAAPRTVMDIVRGALDARLSALLKENGMENSLGGRLGRGALIVAAAALVMPTIFIVAVWLKYGLGRGQVYDPLEAWFTSPLGEAVVVLGPLVALAASALALARVDVAREGGQLVGVVQVRLSVAGLATMALSLGLTALFVLYYVAENY